MNKKIYGTIEVWRNRLIDGEHPYGYLDGIVLKRCWAGEDRNVSLLVAIGVNSEGYRRVSASAKGPRRTRRAGARSSNISRAAGSRASG
jgi:putative transposase